jgi:hypothetical protein
MDDFECLACQKTQKPAKGQVFVLKSHFPKKRCKKIYSLEIAFIHPSQSYFVIVIEEAIATVCAS